MYMEFGKTLLLMYATLLTPIVAGVINSLWCKSNYLLNLKHPIDAGKNFRDGKRIFGDHKTWKGLLGYVVLNAIFMVFFGILFDLLNWNQYSYIWQNHANTPLFNLWIGALIGLAYAVFELPNSFLKRRLDIKPGKSAYGFAKYFFTFLAKTSPFSGPFEWPLAARSAVPPSASEMTAALTCEALLHFVAIGSGHCSDAYTRGRSHPQPSTVP